jgi:thioesterase domain-containing protein
MTDSPDPSLPTLERFILDHIPLARAMDLRVAACDGAVLALDAPLAPNVNDKGCAFGGSLTCLMTLAGWSLVELGLQRHGVDCDIYVADSDVRYLAPVWTDFRAEARFAPGSDWDSFLATLAARGKARVEMACEVREHGGAVVAATLRARFVAKRTPPPAD